MGRPKKAAAAAVEDPAVENIDKVDFEPVPDVSQGVNQAAEGEATEPIEPEITDPRWSDYVMTFFEPDELQDGNPTVPGLRRVTELLLGAILGNRSTVVDSSNVNNNFKATAMCEVTILWTKDVSVAQERWFSDVADVCSANTDKEYARFAASTAATRAEGRALRKALRLKKVAAEELTSTPIEDSLLDDGFISETQINLLEILCSRNDINVVKFINHGKNQYGNIKEVPSDVANKMFQCVSEYQRKQESIPAQIRGYESNWKENLS